MDEWRPDQDWALVDLVPSFTAGVGQNTVTFWQALATSVPALEARTPAELRCRFLEIAPSNSTAGDEPTVLEDWDRLLDGRYTGRLAGQSSFVWLTVATEGRLVSDPREQPGYVESISGRIYELGQPARSRLADGAQLTATGLPPAAQDSADPMSLRLPYAGMSLAMGLLVGAIGYGLGLSSVPATAPPAPRVFLAPPKADPPPANKATAMMMVPATVGEQKERALLRLDRDRAKLQMIQTRIKEDEQRLVEAQRVEAERGASAEAVKLVFPPSS